MDTRQLRHFLALVEHGTYARASDVVHLSQPALSRSIQQLEQQLGASLFERGRFGATLTAHGRAALPHVRSMLAAAESLRQIIQAIDGLQTGALHVGTGPYPALALLDRICARFIDRYPGIRLHIDTDNWQALRRALLDHALELFVADTAELIDDPALEVTPLPQPEMVVFCCPGHPLARSPSLRWVDLLDYPLAMTRLPDDMEHRLQTMSLAHGGLQRRIECDDVAMLVAIVANSKAVSMAPIGVVAEALSSHRLVRLPVEGVDDLHTRYGLVQRRNRQLSPAAQAFRQEMLDSATSESLVGGEETRLNA